MDRRSDSHSDDCWFCLASPSLKTHLIMSVADNAYVALPRGAVEPRHALIIPIECVPSRIHLSQGAKSDLRKFESALDKLYLQQDFASLRFERAIRTKGRDHMQVVVELAEYELISKTLLTQY